MQKCTQDLLFVVRIGLLKFQLLPLQVGEIQKIVQYITINRSLFVQLPTQNTNSLAIISIFH